MVDLVVNPWLGMSAVMAILGGVMGGLHLYQRQCSPHPELVRKLFHIGGGITTLALPWLFASAWPVLALASMTSLGLFMLNHVRTLKVGLGGVLCGVARDSFGEIYFPVGVTLLFVLSGGDVLLYTIPILMLTLADPVAALVGVRYGQLRYTAAAGAKSAEGSVAFFIVAFFSAHVPLLLFTNTGRAESLLIAIVLGLLVTIVEAVARQGLDNLVIPLASFLLLKAFLTMF